MNKMWQDIAGGTSGRSRGQNLELEMGKACVLIQVLQEDTTMELNVQGFDERKCL